MPARQSSATAAPLILGPRATLGGGGPPLFILGPCVIEGESFLWRHARAIAATCAEAGAPFVFKASYDKANRTSGASFRGMETRAGCELLGAIGRELGVPVTTDVHSPAEAELAAEWIDVLQIPAFLCRQTDLITTAAATGRVVNVKKGQFLAPWDVKPIAGKLRAATTAATATTPPELDAGLPLATVSFSPNAAPRLATTTSSRTCVRSPGCARPGF